MKVTSNKFDYAVRTALNAAMSSGDGYAHPDAESVLEHLLSKGLVVVPCGAVREEKPEVTIARTLAGY